MFIDIWIVLLTRYFKKKLSFGATILSVTDLYDLMSVQTKDTIDSVDSWDAFVYKTPAFHCIYFSD